MRWIKLLSILECIQVSYIKVRRIFGTLVPKLNIKMRIDAIAFPDSLVANQLAKQNQYGDRWYANKEIGESVKAY